MKLVITKDLIHKYQDLVDESVTEIRWKAGPLIGSVLKNFPNLHILNCESNRLTSLTGLEHCTQLQKLYCYSNQLTSLTGIEQCTLLQVLYCFSNQLTSLTGIEHCTLLQKLHCSSNQLTTLTEIEQCTQLQKLHCFSNQLTSLKGIEQCMQLQELYCFSNQLTSLTEIEQCTQLQKLHCSSNQLTTLTEIEQCTQLQILGCSNNQLTTLTGIEHCTLLQELYCLDNQLTSLNQIVYLRQLTILHYSDNPLEIQTVQVQRFLARLNGRRTNTNNSIYSDRQNVHDSTIQKSVCDSIQNLLRDLKSEFSIETIIDSDLNQKTKQLLVEYCEDKTEHSHHLITYIELLSYVWARIVGSDHAAELFKILEEQIDDSECKCFTGRFNRTLSVLVGFYPDIQIEISDNSRISAIILAIKDKINPYNATEHRIQAEKQLLDAGYDETVIESWLDAIDY